jgi:hypothetical protein
MEGLGKGRILEAALEFLDTESSQVGARRVVNGLAVEELLSDSMLLEIECQVRDEKKAASIALELKLVEELMQIEHEVGVEIAAVDDQRPIEARGVRAVKNRTLESGFEHRDWAPG